VAQTMYIHASKYKNNKMKGEKKVMSNFSSEQSFKKVTRCIEPQNLYFG
jgi:hypothetical protein